MLKKRIFAGLLTALMIIGLLPVAAFAAGESYNVYFYTLVPNVNATANADPNTVWNGMGIGSVTGVKAPSAYGGNATVSINNSGITVNYPSGSYPDITVDGRTYKYAEAGTEEASQKGYYTIQWVDVLKVADGANSGKNGYIKETVSSGTLTFHMDGQVTLNETDTYTVAFYVKDAGAENFFVQPNSSRRVEEGSEEAKENSNWAPHMAETKTVDGVEYTFDGWYLDEACKQKAEFNRTITQNTNYYGQYVPATHEISYTVEYYQDEIKVENDTTVKKATVDSFVTSLAVDEKDINTVDKYEGFAFDHSEPSVIPNTAENGTTIKIYYATDKKIDPTIPEEERPTGGGDGIPDSWQAEVTFTAVNGKFGDDTTYTTVVTKRDDNKNPSADGNAVLAEEHIKEAAADEGYLNDSAAWTKNGKACNDPAAGTLVQNGDIFTVTFAQSYTVTYTDGVEGAEIFVDQVYKNLASGDPTPAFEGDTPTRTGYTFKGWEPEVTEKVTGSMTYVAQWEAITYTITFDAKGGTPTPPEQVVAMGGKVTEPAKPSYSGCTFDGWYLGETKYDFDTPVTGNLTLTAHWRSSSGGSTTWYTLNYNTNGGEKISYERKSYVWTKSYQSLPTPVRDGYLFDGWYLDSKLTEPVEGDIKINKSSVTIYAKWEKDVADPDNTGVSKWLDTVDHDAYLTGYPDNTFGPDRKMTRAEVAQMFYALLLNKNVAVTVSFSDVEDGAWYTQAVNTLASLGMIAGYPDGTFGPDRPITRAEFTTIAMNFASLDTSGKNIFDDVHSSDWFYRWIVGAIKYGWIGGYPDGSFRPDSTITRAEVTCIVNNMLGRSADQDYVDAHPTRVRQFADLADSFWGYYQIMEATTGHDYSKRNNQENWSCVR